MKQKFINLVIAINLLFVLNGSAQTTPGLKKFIPPSPNAAALGKYGDIPVGLYTGIPSISIPLYTLKGRDLELPINLSYHAGGIKVEEIASWVGIGWSLNAGGVITRSVRGFPDDVPTGYFNNRSTIVPLAKKYIANLNPTTSYLIGAGNADQADLQMLNQVKDQVTDAEPDIFYFNFGKYSGKFFMNENGQFVVSPLEALKIEYQYISGVNANQIARWTLTTPDGVKYVFGNSLDGQKTAIEKNDNAAQTGITTTGWYLMEIYSPNNDLITLDYNTISYNYNNKSAETINFILDESGSQPPAHLPSFDKNVVTNFMTVPKLKSITSANGKITFDATTRRTDLPGDTSLSAVNIFSNVDLINPLRKFVFYYDYVNGGRLTLDSLAEFSATNAASGNKYKFEYNTTQLPNADPYGTTINSQDLWGYYNGVPNSVLPQSFYITTPPYGTITIFGADRHSDESYMMAGVLKKIIYPTGGYSLFEYEANKVYASNSDNSIPTPPAGKYASLQYLTGQTLADTFTVSYATSGGVPGGTTRVTVSSIAMGHTQPPGCQISPSGYSTCYTASIEGINGTSFPIQYIKDGTSTVDLANGTYKIVGKGELVQGYPNASYLFYLDLNWNEYPPQGNGGSQSMVNKTIGGLRIKRITSNDNISTSVKKYLYTKFNDTASSGVLVNNPYHYANVFEILSGCGATNYAQVRSYPLTPLLQTQGSSIGYQNVTELAGENGENGKTEYSYTTATDFPDDLKEYRPYPPSCTYDWRRGQLLKSTVYKNSSGNFIAVKSNSNKYTFGAKSSAGYGLSVETGIQILQCASPLVTLAANAYYVSGYKTISEFYYLQSDTTKVYDQNTPSSYVQNINTYNYDTSNGHYQLTSTVTQSSKNETLQTDIKYPQDIVLTGAAETARQSLISKFMLTPVIDQITSRNGAQISKTRTNYKVFGNGLTLPESIELQISSNPSEKRVEFLKYDGYGNMIQQHKMADVLNSYIWDYSSSYPIAAIINADSSSVAYTSFEADGKGNWTFSAFQDTDATAPTGKKALYITATNKVSKSGLTIGKSYIVSFWSKHGLYTINGCTNTYKMGKTINGWTYYEYAVVPTATTITINGNSGGVGSIDEVRLYPSDAQMTTYTYQPLIGMTSQCDVNNRISYFEYDAFGRVRLIKDQDKNVIKKFCYNYAGQPANCDVAVPVSVTITNSLNLSGFTATYTNTVTLQQTAFTVPTTGNLIVTLPSGTYDLIVNRTAGNVGYAFTTCALSTNCGMTVHNITVNTNSCNTLLVESSL